MAIVCSLITLACLPLTSVAITEFVGLGPADGGPPPHHPPVNEINRDRAAVIVKWLQLDYEPTASSAKEVKGKFVTSKPAELGHWFDLDLTKGGGKFPSQMIF